MDYEHPTSITSRVCKNVLPNRAIITKDAKAILNTSASMFTLYLSAMAHENAVKHKRQTITLNDVMQALTDIDFAQFALPIEDCLRATKQLTASKKSNKTQSNGFATANTVDGDELNDLNEDVESVSEDNPTDEEGAMSVEEHVNDDVEMDNESVE